MKQIPKLALKFQNRDCYKLISEKYPYDYIDKTKQKIFLLDFKNFSLQAVSKNGILFFIIGNRIEQFYLTRIRSFPKDKYINFILMKETNTVFISKKGKILSYVLMTDYLCNWFNSSRKPLFILKNVVKLNLLGDEDIEYFTKESGNSSLIFSTTNNRIGIFNIKENKVQLRSLKKKIERILWAEKKNSELLIYCQCQNGFLTQINFHQGISKNIGLKLDFFGQIEYFTLIDGNLIEIRCKCQRNYLIRRFEFMQLSYFRQISKNRSILKMGLNLLTLNLGKNSTVNTRVIGVNTEYLNHLKMSRIFELEKTISNREKLCLNYRFLGANYLAKILNQKMDVIYEIKIFGCSRKKYYLSKSFGTKTGNIVLANEEEFEFLGGIKSKILGRISQRIKKRSPISCIGPLVISISEKIEFIILNLLSFEIISIISLGIPESRPVCLSQFQIKNFLFVVRNKKEKIELWELNVSLSNCKKLGEIGDSEISNNKITTGTVNRNNQLIAICLENGFVFVFSGSKKIFTNKISKKRKSICMFTFSSDRNDLIAVSHYGDIIIINPFRKKIEQQISSFHFPIETGLFFSGSSRFCLFYSHRIIFFIDLQKPLKFIPLSKAQEKILNASSAKNGKFIFLISEKGRTFFFRDMSFWLFQKKKNRLYLITEKVNIKKKKILSQIIDKSITTKDPFLILSLFINLSEVLKNKIFIFLETYFRKVNHKVLKIIIRTLNSVDPKGKASDIWKILVNVIFLISNSLTFETINLQITNLVKKIIY